MSEPAKKTDSRLLVTVSVEELEAILQRVMLRASPKEDRLLTIEEVCQMLNVNSEWVYHHVKKLPFVRKLGGMLRFSSNGLQRYIESTKFTVKGD
jgi:excisionase family DNA binding protein